MTNIFRFWWLTLKKLDLNTFANEVKSSTLEASALGSLQMSSMLGSILVLSSNLWLFFHPPYFRVLPDFIQMQKQFCYLFTSQGNIGALLQKGMMFVCPKGQQLPGSREPQGFTGSHQPGPISSPPARQQKRSQVQPSFQIIMQGHGDRAGSRSDQEVNPQVRSSECQAAPQRQRRGKVNMERVLGAGLADKDVFKATY